MHVYVHIVAKFAEAKPLPDAHFCDPPEAAKEALNLSVLP
jgi:hypothetical protein